MLSFREFKDWCFIFVMVGHVLALVVLFCMGNEDYNMLAAASFILWVCALTLSVNRMYLGYLKFHNSRSR